MLEKNREYTLTIESVSSDGNGVAHLDGVAVFVPNSVPGDTAVVRLVKIKKSYCFGKILSLVTAGHSRVTPDCGIFQRCGGCSTRVMTYEAECQAKQQWVEDAMRRIGGVTIASQPIIAAERPDGYRNKAQYPFSKERKVGFFAPRSHDCIVLPDGHCALQPAVFDRAIRVVEEFAAVHGLSVYNETSGTGLLRHLYLRLAEATGKVMVVLVINGDHIPFQRKLIDKLMDALGESLQTVLLNHNTARTNVVLGKADTVIYGPGFLTDVLCGVTVRLSPHAFYQVNHDMAERLYEKAAAYACPDDKCVLDLYCGAGTIGLSMAHRAKTVIGVEIVPEAIENAKENAALNGFTNTRFLCGDASDVAHRLAQEGVHPDVVIVDPPRKGCDQTVLRTIAYDFMPERLVYVSCDPATLARDTAYLQQNGYVLQSYTPCDLFPRTAHVESVALLVRTDSVI